MRYFECCHYCKPPKRYPGCHSKCSEYAAEKKLWDAYKATENKARHEEALTFQDRRRNKYKKKY